MKLRDGILSWLTALLIPAALILTGLRLLLTPLFLQVEYRMPGFPADTYGFNLQDRLRWAPYALDYLLNDADISYLADLRFDDGGPLYNQRELDHMVDVKVLTGMALRAWAAVLGGLAVFSIWAWRADAQPAYRLGLRRGGWLTVGLVVVVLLLVAVNFWELFSAFHALFFEGDTWLFLYSDTLIRLFPMRFWQDAFILVGLIAVGGGLGLAFGLRPRRAPGV